METRQQTKQKTRLMEKAEGNQWSYEVGEVATGETSRDLPKDMNEIFEEHVTEALKEVKAYILKAEAERIEFGQQIDTLIQLVESQKSEMRRIVLANDERYSKIEARVQNLESRESLEQQDDRTYGVLMSFIETKLEKVEEIMRRVETVEQKLELEFKGVKSEPRQWIKEHEDSGPVHVDTMGTRKSLKPIQYPPTYDGSAPWEAYYAQFEIVSRINEWTSEEKASFLATSLKGNATLILSNLSYESRSDFNSLVKALSNRFGTSHQSELARVKFKNRLKRREESLPELT